MTKSWKPDNCNIKCEEFADDRIKGCQSLLITTVWFWKFIVVVTGVRIIQLNEKV